MFSTARATSLGLIVVCPTTTVFRKRAGGGASLGAVSKMPLHRWSWPPNAYSLPCTSRPLW